MRAKIIHLIQKTEQTIDHLKFMFSSMPTSEGFMDSLQVDMVERTWTWYPDQLPPIKKLLLYRKKLALEHALKWIGKPLIPYYRWILIPYWETTKIDVKRTIARMSRNGGIS